MRRLLPVFVLVIMSPLMAELLWGSIPVTRAFALLFLIPMYGGGALLIRELARRGGRGWGSIVLLGAAFGIVEEGLALQSFFNPTLYGAAEWGAHVLGINGVYTEWAIGYHAVWSITIPILLTDLLFPAQRNTPYLGRVGLIITGIIYVLGVVLIGFSARAAIAPGYWASPVLLGLATLTVLVLAVVALVLLPHREPESQHEGNVSSPWVALLVSGICGFAWQFVLINLRHFLPVIVQGVFVLIPMLGVIIMAVGVIWFVQKSAQSRGWSDLHLLALASGALVAHTVFGVWVLVSTTADRLGLSVLGLIMTVLLILFALRIRSGVNPYDSSMEETEKISY
ncbi:MAG TPA: hypothetical protein VFB12_05720 [Ktedonobacteraceae bacterium]|nr:hypothetical protein [Ktedonobacteraceae bacterium]